MLNFERFVSKNYKSITFWRKFKIRFKIWNYLEREKDILQGGSKC